MDEHRIPIAMNLFQEKENEIKHMITLQEKLAEEYKLEDKKTIIFNDAAMCINKIKQFNIKDGRAFVIT